MVELVGFVEGEKGNGKGKSKGNDSVASAAPSLRRYTPTSKNARRGPRLRQSSGRLAMRPRREVKPRCT